MTILSVSGLKFKRVWTLNNKVSIAKLKFQYNHLVLSLFILVIAILLIWWLHEWSIEAKKSYRVMWVVFDNMSIALIITSLWHSVNQYFLKKEFLTINSELNSDLKTLFVENNSSLARQFESSRKDAMLGLIDTYHDVKDFDYSSFVSKPKNLTVVLSDGYSWISGNMESLRERLSNPHMQTNIFIVHPESTLTTIIANKIGQSEEYFKSKIYMTIKLVKDEFTNNKNIKLVGHFSITHHAIYLGDNTMAITPYYFSKRKRNPPVLVFEEGTYLSRTRDDLADLLIESEDLMN